MPREYFIRKLLCFLRRHSHVLQLLDLLHSGHEVEPSTIHFNPLRSLMLMVAYYLTHCLAVVLAEPLLRDDVALNHVLVVLVFAGLVLILSAFAPRRRKL